MPSAVYIKSLRDLINGYLILQQNMHDFLKKGVMCPNSSTVILKEETLLGNDKKSTRILFD